MKTNNKKTSTVYKLLSASFAFVIWGGWAYFVNSSDNLRTSLTAGLTQGTASFIITLIMVYFISIIYNILPSNLATLLKTLLPAMITISITGTGLYLMHSMMATLNIAKTIAPALSVAFLFSLFTAYKLQQNDKT